MNNIEEIEQLLWWREKHMQIMLIALLECKFAPSKELRDSYFKYAQYFGKVSNDFKRHIDKLTQEK